MSLSRGKNWSTNEDEQLCRSWLHVSKDPIKGTDQAKQAFWLAIKTHAEQHVQEITGRPSESVRQRFGTISHLVSKYVGCLAFVERSNKSGTTEADNLQAARTAFMKETNQKTFRIQGCYELLKDEPKFADLSNQQKLNRKRTKVVTNCGIYIHQICIFINVYNLWRICLFRLDSVQTRVYYQCKSQFEPGH